MDVLTVGLVAGVFYATKSVFRLVGWYTKNGPEDKVLRRRLLKTSREVRGMRPSTVVRRAVARFQRRWEQSFPWTWRGVCRFAALSLALNAGASVAYSISPMSMFWKPAFPYPASHTAMFLAYVLSYSTLGLFLDLLSKAVSSWILRHALRGDSLRRLMAGVAADLVLLGLVMSLNLVLSYTAAAFTVGWREMGVRSWSDIAEAPAFVWYDIAGSLLVVAQVALVMPFTRPAFGLPHLVGAGLQTVLYAIFTFLVLAVRLAPAGTSRVFAKVIRRIADEDQPVFSQLGNVCGGVAGLLTLVVRLLTPGA